MVKAAAKPIGMSSVGSTTLFPREDNLYRKKESLPFDESQARIWKDRPKDETKEAAKEWLAYTVMGIMIGSTAFFMKVLEEHLLEWGVETIQHTVDITTA